ncbi:MAG: hypothetical protein R3Y28_03890 [Candidatus Gastranaerophilales bacterium]
MSKKAKSVLGVLVDGFSIYFKNFSKFFKYMSFPVLGQILGLVLVFVPSLFYSFKLPELIIKYDFFNNFLTIIITSLLITLPGLFVLLKAFWEFLVAYGALNSVAESAVTTGKVYDFDAHKAVVTKRSFSFIVLWFVVSVLSAIALNPLLIVLGVIFFVYFVLVFQVFILEKCKPVECFKRSMALVKGNFFRTFFLLIVLFVITYNLLNLGVVTLFEISHITTLLTKSVMGLALQFPFDVLNSSKLFLLSNYVLTADILAKFMIDNLIFFVVVGYTLPLRSICWTLWYKNLRLKKEIADKKNVKKTSSKPSSKIVKKEVVKANGASVKKKTAKKIKPKDRIYQKDFKIEKREIDPEIIRRARMNDYDY